MRITILLVISLLYIETDSKSTSSSWFQEKYLDEKYNHYYKYAFETDYEDRNTCPEIHKPAMMNAVTGATQYTVTTLRRRIIPTPPIAVSATTPETDPPLFQRFKTRFYILDITIRDIVLFIIDILVIIAHWIYCIWQVVSMTVMLTMTIIVTWLVLVMFFGQY